MAHPSLCSGPQLRCVLRLLGWSRPRERGFGRALACWRGQARAWESPNAGPVMAAGAGALGVALGGGASYGGQWHMRPPLGEGPAPTAADIGRAVALVRHAVWLWLGVAIAIAGVAHA